jgi:hypothetical protein
MTHHLSRCNYLRYVDSHVIHLGGTRLSKANLDKYRYKTKGALVYSGNAAGHKIGKSS